MPTKIPDSKKLGLQVMLTDTAVFTASFHVINESGNFTKYGGLLGGRSMGGGRKSDGYIGKFTWRIDNFTRLKDLLKKRKITGLSIKSKKFQIGDRDCRLIVIPRAIDWSCFVSLRLSVVNQRMEDKSIVKESQNRYSKGVKDLGWHELVTLNSLFDQDSGFLVQDSIVFSAEVHILKESAERQVFSGQVMQLSNAGGQTEVVGAERSFTWKVENFSSFKEIIETPKIFSKFSQVGGFELRIVQAFLSLMTLCMLYLESDQSAGIDTDKNFWVRYKMGVVNQKKSDKTLWKESSIFTNTWKDSVLKFMKVSDMLEGDAGFLLRDTIVFVCYIMDCCPWFEFSDLEVLAFEEDRDALSTDPAEIIDSEDTEGISGDDEDIFRNHARAGFHLTFGGSSSQPRVSKEPKPIQRKKWRKSTIQLVPTAPPAAQPETVEATVKPESVVEKEVPLKLPRAMRATPVYNPFKERNSDHKDEQFENREVASMVPSRIPARQTRDSDEKENHGI